MRGEGDESGKVENVTPLAGGLGVASCFIHRFLHVDDGAAHSAYDCHKGVNVFLSGSEALWRGCYKGSGFAFVFIQLGFIVDEGLSQTI